MRKLIVVLMSVIVLCSVAFAQQQEEEQAPVNPKKELFAGYSYVHSGLQNYGLGSAGLSGELLQATYFLHGNLGARADVMRATGTNVAQSGVNVSRYTYLFGPVYAVRSDSTFTPFAHVLFGMDHERFSVSYLGETITKSFAAALGGGVDAKLGEHFAVRAGQLDYIHTSHGGGENHLRYTAGLVIRF